MTVAELNVLLKFLGTLGDLPKIELGDTTTRGERLGLWRAAMDAQLKTTRRVVTTWWNWCYSVASNHYQRWLKTPIIERNQIKILDVLPLKLETIED